MSDSAPDTTLRPLQVEGKEAPPKPRGNVGEDVVRARSPRLFDSEAARQAGQRSGEVRREKREARDASAELDRLAVQARVSVALARKLTYEKLEQIIGALAEEAAKGKPTPAKLLLDYIRLLSPDEDDGDVDQVDPRKLTRQQRAAVRAALLAEAEGVDVTVDTVDIESMRAPTGAATTSGEGTGGPARA